MMSIEEFWEFWPNFKRPRNPPSFQIIAASPLKIVTCFQSGQSWCTLGSMYMWQLIWWLIFKWPANQCNRLQHSAAFSSEAGLEEFEKWSSFKFQPLLLLPILLPRLLQKKMLHSGFFKKTFTNSPLGEIDESTKHLNRRLEVMCSPPSQPLEKSTREDATAFLNFPLGSKKWNHLLFGPKFIWRFCESQPPAYIGWEALSSVIVWSFVVPHLWHLLSSPLYESYYDVSDYTNHIFSVRIWSWQHVSVIWSVFIAELSPVYCCLLTFCWSCS